TVGASGLAIVISANAVQTAPTALAVTISTSLAAAGAAIATTSIATAAKTIAMTTPQKSLITTTLIAAIGTGIYQARQASLLRNEVQSLQLKQTANNEQIEQLSRERDDAKQIARLSTKTAPRLPAPRMLAAAPIAEAPMNAVSSTN